MRKRTQVVIVGAGPVGLTAAMALSRRGIGVRVLEAGDRFDTRLRASLFHPPTLDMLDEFGVVEQLERAGLKVRFWQLRNHDSGEQVRFDLDAIKDDTRHPYRLQVEQQVFCAVAAERLSDYGTSIEFETALSDLNQGDDGVVVHTSSGERIDADYVVGADGRKSATRDAVGAVLGGTTATYASVLLATTFPFQDKISNLCDISYCWSRHGPFALLRLKHCWRVSLRTQYDDLDAAMDEQSVRDRLAHIHADARDAHLLGTTPYRIEERCIDRMRIGRVLLAGNAAHINPPSGGMGMNAGIHDAVNLSDKLARVLAGEDNSLLDRYDRERRHAMAQSILPQAVASRDRMSGDDAGAASRRLARYKSIVADSEKCRDFLLASSMITSLRKAAALE